MSEWTPEMAEVGKVSRGITVAALAELLEVRAALTAALARIAELEATLRLADAVVTAAREFTYDTSSSWVGARVSHYDHRDDEGEA